ncbi:MAG: cysteine hydrolase [Planctomycetota bacterium]
MKTDYVQPENIVERAHAWLEELKPYTRHPFQPASLGQRPCLLILDMQRFFIDESSPAYIPAGKALIAPIENLLEAFRSRNFPVIFTRHVDRPNDIQGPMYTWWNHLMKPDHPLSELYPAFADRPREIVTVKNQYSAFHSTRLELLLKQLRVSSLSICGVMTHLCCDSTARDAFMRGFKVTVLVDAMATLNETLHLSSLRGLVHGFATPTLSKEVIGGIGS